MKMLSPEWRWTRQLKMEDAIGTIEAGKLADLAILDRNIMEFESPEELLKTSIGVSDPNSPRSPIK